MPPVRVRFAPSPTGYVHVGNARTALFNWLFARHSRGAMVLRVEDTDLERSREEFERQLLDDLGWLRLDWDEGPDRGGPFAPYRQSERKASYQELARQLIARESAYYCFCSPQQLEAERQEALKAGKQPLYSGRCRKIALEEATRRKEAGEPAAIRLKIVDSAFRWSDRVHGLTQFSGEVIGDFILLRSDGNPAYNFAVVVDDHRMEISHVIRGDDHISNTPRQLAVYRAFDWEPPEFAHLSTILGPDRARLSKRHGATSIENFREMGILPEALRNYLALLGWSPADGKTEILSDRELIAQFSLDHITKSPAVFDRDKLLWLNRHYMKQAPLSRLAVLSIPVLEQAQYLKAAPSAEVVAWLEHVVDAVLKDLDTISQLPTAARVIFHYDGAEAASAEATRRVAEDEGSRQVLKAFIPRVLEASPLTYEGFRQIAKDLEKEIGRRGKELFHPLRVALTGAVSGPELQKLIPIFEEGATLPLSPPVKSCAARLREFARAARLD